MVSALARAESRGGHFREDYPTRDDVNFMRHTMAYRTTSSAGAGDPPRLQACYSDPLQADGAEVLMATDPAFDPPAGLPPGQPGSQQHKWVSKSFDLTLKIRRYDPERDAEPHWETYTVSAEPTDRLLDALHKVKWEIDGSLTFRRSCAHGIWLRRDADQQSQPARLQDPGARREPRVEVTVEPIKGLTVLKDLIVDMEPFFEAYRSVMPYLVTTGNEPTRERLQSPEERERYDDTTSASSAPPALRRARSIGTTASTSGPRRSSVRIGSSSTAATRPTSAWRSSTTARVSGAAGRLSTAPRPALAASRSPRRSRRSRALIFRRV